MALERGRSGVDLIVVLVLAQSCNTRVVMPDAVEVISKLCVCVFLCVFEALVSVGGNSGAL